MKVKIAITPMGYRYVRPFDPLPESHPAVGMPCYLCQQPIQPHDITCLIPVEATDDKWIERCEIAHYSCVTSNEVDDGTGE